jgi:hypothetical protein
MYSSALDVKSKTSKQVYSDDQTFVDITYLLVKIEADAGEGFAGRALTPMSFVRASHGEVLVKRYARFGALVASAADLLQQRRRYATVIASLSN